jgi:hypothetical protein
MPQTLPTEYASPVLRGASPASSLNTPCPDQPLLSDDDDNLPPLEFKLKWEERLGIGMPRPEELQANENPLLPKPTSPAEEKGELLLCSVTNCSNARIALVEQVMRSLQRQVQLLQENDLFEQTVLRGSQVGHEIQPTSNDIDVLIQGLMSHDEDAMMTDDAPITNGPWNYHGMGPYAAQTRNTTHTNVHPASRRQ